MGSIKIFNDSMSCFFDNGFGDGENRVDIVTKKTDTSKMEFLGHFTVKTEAHLSRYDCEDDAAHTFGKGRYFVHLVKLQHFVIQKEDEDIHA